MERLFFLVPLILVSGIGYLSIKRELNNIILKRNFALQYQNTLVGYINSQGKDTEAYTWLTLRSIRMQTDLGILDIIRYKPPFSDYMYENFAVVPNILPEIQRTLSSFSYFGQANEFSNMLQVTLLRYIGVLDDDIEAITKDKNNPLIWFREGIKFILILPLSTLSTIGVLSYSTVNWLTKNSLFKFLGGVVAAISFFSAVVGLIIGWEDFVKIINQLLSVN